MEFFKSIEEILEASSVAEKKEKFAKFYAKFCVNEVEFEQEFSPKPLTKPFYAKFLKIEQAKDIKIKNKNLKKQSVDKNALFLHSVAHIEFSAIDLALDACYRFVGLPREFYADWLEVANDEIRHFDMINAELEKTGFKYGDFSVHDGLFEALKKTETSLLERMAVVPRHLEAGGLDANFYMLSQIDKNPEKSHLKPLLEVILNEEISHVGKGDKWFKFECQRLGVLPECFFEIVLKYYPKAFSTTRTINENARLKAGYSPKEIEKIKELQSGK